MALTVDQQFPLHTGQHLFHMRGRSVSGVGTKLQSQQFIADPTHVPRSILSPFILVEEGVGQSPDDAQSVLGVFFLLFLSTVELLGILDQTLKPALFLLHWRRGGSRIIVRNHHPEHCIASLHVYFGLRTVTRFSAGTKTMLARRVFGSGYFMCDGQTH